MVTKVLFKYPLGYHIPSHMRKSPIQDNTTDSVPQVPQGIDVV